MILRDKNNQVWLWGALLQHQVINVEFGYFIAPCPKYVNLYDVKLQNFVTKVKISDNIYKSNINNKVYNIVLIREHI